MCFLVKQSAKVRKMAEKYGPSAQDIADAIADAEQKSSAFSHPRLWTLTSQGPQALRWGLIPAWTPNRERALQIRKQTLNAMGETAWDKPSFKDSMRSRRCVVPVDEFYEWRHEGKAKIPYAIANPADAPLLLAGIWDTWIAPQSGTPVATVSVLTCAANHTMAHVHNSKLRMPVVLAEETLEEWLGSTPEGRVRELLRPCPDSWLRAIPSEK